MTLVPLELVPNVAVILFFATAAICFCLSYLSYRHVTYLWPYISDTGNYPPESCIFAQGLNVVALLFFFLMFVKFSQIKEIYKEHNIDEKWSINTMAFAFGITSCLGITLVANFQMTNVFIVHVLGAVMTFGGGSMYACLQSYIYTTVTHVIGQRKTTILRIILSVGATITLIGQNVTAIKSFMDFTGKDPTKWEVEDGGFEVHQVSTILEWICSVLIMIYILLFYEDLKYTKIRLTVVFQDRGAAPLG